MIKLTFKTSESMGCYFAIISNESAEITFCVSCGYELDGFFNKPQHINISQQISSNIQDFEAHAKLVNEVYVNAMEVKKAIDYTPFILVSNSQADMILLMNCIVIELERTLVDIHLAIE